MAEITYSDDSILYDDIFEKDLTYFEENLQEHYDTLPDFFEFHSSFSHNSGKQGVLGLLSNKNNKRKYVYKISQYLNNNINHEYLVINQLNDIREYCPHFCKTLGKFSYSVLENYKKVDNPFDTNDDYSKKISTDVLLMEMVEGRSLYRYMKNDKIISEVTMSLIKQTLLATILANESINFTHYDLHSKNILVKKCPTNSVFLYVLDEHRTYLVPTYGYYPIIIDFGFSFSSNCEGNPFYSCLSQTDIGFIPAVQDKNADPKLFLSSVSYEFKNYKDSEISYNFRKLVKNIYKDCSVDLECGWDTGEDKSISEQLLKKMNGQFKRSRFLRHQGHHITDLLQSLITLPLRSKDSSDTIEDMVGCVVTEFIKIENEISSEFYNIYIFKSIVDATRKYKKEYISGDRDTAVSNFKAYILKKIDSVTKFCCPKNINWEKLLCSLLCLARAMENFMYHRLKKLLAHKKVDYNNMPLKSPTEIFEAIEANIPSHFFLDKDTTIYMFNCIEKKSCRFKINDDKMIESLNETHPFERGTLLYEYVSSEDL